jgi:hypothetical protein
MGEERSGIYTPKLTRQLEGEAKAYEKGTAKVVHLPLLLIYQSSSKLSAAYICSSPMRRRICRWTGDGVDRLVQMEGADEGWGLRI